MKKLKSGFTLLELMIVIAIIWISIIWATNISFNSLSNKQRVEWFFYKIKNNIETVKNNVLIWRETFDWTNTIVADIWNIDFNNSLSWSVKTYYYDQLDIKKSFWDFDIIPEKFYEIIVYNDWNRINDSETASIIINWRNLSLTGITTNNKILEIETKYKDKSKRFTINTISWVIEEIN